jgi:hypothetical protein
MENQDEPASDCAALEARIKELEEERDQWMAAARGYEDRLAAAQAALERDRTAVAAGVSGVLREMASYSWLKEGRGSYAYDDETWHAEFADAMAAVEAALEPLRAIAADWSDCPTNPEDIAAARATDPRLAAAQAEGREQMREEAALVVENYVETIHERRDGTNRYLSPRKHGNIVALAYASGIRALPSAPREETTK